MSIQYDGLSVTVLRVTPVLSSGNVLALVDITVGPLIIHSCRVIRQPGQQPWVAMPPTQTADGRWYPVIQICDDNLRQAVRDRVLAACGPDVLGSDDQAVAP